MPDLHTIPRPESGDQSARWTFRKARFKTKLLMTFRSTALRVSTPDFRTLQGLGVSDMLCASAPTMVGIAQLVRASVCGTEGRGFESRYPPLTWPRSDPRHFVSREALQRPCRPDPRWVGARLWRTWPPDDFPLILSDSSSQLADAGMTRALK